MELRHLRYFIAVAEELHFARAAERLHMEQSPLSRAIKDLEFDVGVKLLDRTTRSTRITWAGNIFLDEARRILATVDQAKAKAKAAAQGRVGQLRVGYSDGIAQIRLSNLLAQCRASAPAVEVRVLEMPFMQQLKSLRNGLLDVGLTMSCDVGSDIVVEVIWSDPLVVLTPTNHPLSLRRHVTLEEAVQVPLVLCDPDADPGCFGQLDTLVRSANEKPTIAEHAQSFGAMLVLVGAGYGIGFAISSQAETIQRPDVAIRPFAGRPPELTTYLLRPIGTPSAALVGFLDRAHAIP